MLRMSRLMRWAIGLLLLLCSLAAEATEVLRGRVTDKEGKPMPGVTIRVRPVRVDTVSIPRELVVQPASERQPWWRRWLTAIGALVVVGAGAIGIYKLIGVLR